VTEPSFIRVGFGGEQIQAEERSFIEENNPRSVAKWVGGLEELENLGFVQDRGNKGEVFQVTREGYEFYDSFLK
jgi:hypothetical protein